MPPNQVMKTKKPTALNAHLVLPVCLLAIAGALPDLVRVPAG